VPNEVWEVLAREAKEREISISKLIVEILQTYVASKKALRRSYA
jgi:predicted HicB family RNase H-like nuclease